MDSADSMHRVIEPIPLALAATSIAIAEQNNIDNVSGAIVDIEEVNADMLRHQPVSEEMRLPGVSMKSGVGVEARPLGLASLGIASALASARRTPRFSSSSSTSSAAASGVQTKNTPSVIATEPVLPYIVITGLKASVDSSIDQYVKELIDRVTLKEVPVNKGTVTANSTTTKFSLADGEFPKIQVELYEQMVYHRSTSINMKPLEILVPTRYKINHEKILQYFSDKVSDESTNALVTGVVEEYGNHNSLFYKHTISGKSNPSGLNLDEKKRKIIETRIDKWHNDYAGWLFYDNASTFFLQNREIPRDELITLRMELVDVFGDGTTTKGLRTFVDESTKKYTELIDLYTKSGEGAITFFNDTLVPYAAVFVQFLSAKHILNGIRCGID